MKPLVSVVIPTYNSGHHLNRCLESISKQTYGKIEVIVVDQSSTDNTLQIARKFKSKVVKQPAPTFYSPPSRSRNIGARASKGQIIYHLDSDMELSPELINEAVIKLGDQSIAALIVHEKDIAENFWARCKAIERRCYWGNDKIESARVVRRTVFEKIGGYDEKISSGEDFDIHRRYKRLGGVGFCEKKVQHRLGSPSFTRLVWKKYQYGKTAKEYFKKNQESGASLLFEQLKCYLKNYRLFLRHPLLGFGSLTLKSCEFLAGGLGSIFGTAKS